MKLRIYIIEDSESIMQRISRLISAVEETEIVGSSGNIDEALDSIKNLKPEVVILDISVEKVKGLKMIQDIKQMNPFTKVVMFTNYDFQSYKDKSYEYGADYYLDKSQEFEKLAGILEVVKKNHKNAELVEIL
jgi:DNA-binding NarL/FixJ family response regulator